jgi:fido (protein-threonine AMPylation protein)
MDASTTPLGIADAAELAPAEAALSASRLIDLVRRRLPDRYDLAHPQAFHRYILGGVYARLRHSALAESLRLEFGDTPWERRTQPDHHFRTTLSAQVLADVAWACRLDVPRQ